MSKPGSLTRSSAPWSVIVLGWCQIVCGQQASQEPVPLEEDPFQYIIWETSGVVPEPPYGRGAASHYVGLSLLLILPREFNNCSVRTTGVIALELEGNALYLSRVAYENRHYNDGVALRLPPDWSLRQELRGKQVTVSGSFLEARNVSTVMYFPPG